MHTYRCNYCDDEYESKKEIKDSSRRYCPYCYAVKFGEPDASWIPGIKDDEIDRRGFHKI